MRTARAALRSLDAVWSIGLDLAPLAFWIDEFAEAVRQEEREACAKIADSHSSTNAVTSAAKRLIAEEIRARGEQVGK